MQNPGKWPLQLGARGASGVTRAHQGSKVQEPDARLPVAEALGEAEAPLRPVAHTRDALACVIRVLEGHGLDARATTLVFHPIGLDAFDFAEPEHADRGWRLEADTVVNFEVFHRDAEFAGMHLEDSVVACASGLDYFSDSPRDLIVVGA